MHFFDDIESILDLFEDDNSIGQGNWFHQDNTANVSLEHLGSLEVYCSLDGLNCTGKELCAGSDDEKRKESKKRNGAGQVHGKARSKRVRRVWSLNSPLPLGGVSRVLPSKRSCSHCKTEETPQWRMGPLGPKTLCNACGVRYKSGRLVPEYRPAASPSFVSHLHSNSHKKIMMMRGLTK